MELYIEPYIKLQELIEQSKLFTNKVLNKKRDFQMNCELLNYW